jgi:hypothetical protein
MLIWSKLSNHKPGEICNNLNLTFNIYYLHNCINLLFLVNTIFRGMYQIPMGRDYKDFIHYPMTVNVFCNQ